MMTRRRYAFVLTVGLVLAFRPVSGRAQVTSYAVLPHDEWAPPPLRAVVTFIDTDARSVIGSPVQVAYGPYGVAFTPDGRRAFITNSLQSAVTVLDVATRQPLTPVFSARAPIGVAITPDGARALVSQSNDGTLMVIRVADLTREPDITVGPGPGALAISPDSQRAYVVNTPETGDPFVTIVDLAARTTVGQLPLAGGSRPGAIAVAPDGRTAYVAGTWSDIVTPLDLVTSTVGTPIAVDSAPRGVAVSPDSRSVYVACLGSNRMPVIDAATRTVVARIPLPLADVTSSSVAFAPDGRVAYATISNGVSTFGVITIDTATRQVVPAPRIATPAGLEALGSFVGPNVVVPGGVLRPALTIDNDDDLTALGFGRYVPFNGGTLRLTGDWTTTRQITVLSNPAGSTIDTHGFHAVWSNGLVNDGLLIKRGAGTLTFAGTDAPANGAVTMVTEGALIVTGTHRAGVVVAGGTLTGAGTVGRVDVTSGILEVGLDGRGELHAEQIVFGANTVLRIDLDGGTAGVDYSRLVVRTDARLTGAHLALVPSTRVPVNTPLTVLVRNGGSGTFVGVPEGGTIVLADRGTFRVTYAGGDGDDVAVTLIDAAPTISGLEDRYRTIPVGSYLGPLPFTIGDDLTPTSALRIDVHSSNQDLIANPNATPAPITITFLKEDGTTIDQSRTLPATSRTTIRADDIAGLESTAMSTRVVSSSGLPLIVERTMWWGATAYGAHTEKATAGAARQWLFAEGSQGFFSTYFLLVNPDAAANTAHVTYLRENDTPIVRDYALLPSSRRTIDAGSDPALVDRLFGAIVTFDLPGVAERAMYFGRTPLFAGGHEAAGVTDPSTHWFLAEGATGSFFTTFVLLANPGQEDAHATLTYLPAVGAPVVRRVTVPARQRVTRNIATEDTALASAAVATQVEADRPLIVERAQYWPNPVATWTEAHSSFGVTETATRWGLAEGRVGGSQSHQTYILLANPGTVESQVGITFLRTNGTVVVKSFRVPPTSRVNVAVTGPDSDVPELTDESFGAVIDATAPIAVERSLYSNAAGVIWAAGTNATATRLP